MPSAPGRISRSGVLLTALVLSGALSAQPVCDVLLRPAFHYTTDGLSVMLADSSTTFGQVATTSISFGDGASATSSLHHTFEAPGTYTVCMTLSTSIPNCSSTYCREVTVPLVECGSVNALFDVVPGTTNSLSLTAMSIGAFNGERLWEFGDGATSDLPAPTHTWILPGPHFVTLTLIEGQCRSTYGRWLGVDGNATTCGPGLFLDFTTNMEGTNGRFDPQIVNNGVIPMLGIWSFGDGNMDTAMVGMNNYATEGVYQTCLLVGALVPPSMDTCFSIVCHTAYILPQVGLNEQDRAAFRAWPNPFRDVIHIDALDRSTGTTAQLLDALGRCVVSWRLREMGVSSADLGRLPDGAYTLVLRSANEQRRVRLLKLAE